MANHALRIEGTARFLLRHWEATGETSAEIIIAVRRLRDWLDGFLAVLASLFRLADGFFDQSGSARGARPKPASRAEQPVGRAEFRCRLGLEGGRFLAICPTDRVEHKPFLLTFHLCKLREHMPSVALVGRRHCHDVYFA